MTLPNGFMFTQGKLQCFSECRRRFELHYLERVAWPAVEIEPAEENEQYRLQGERFHLMVYQHQMGVPADLVSRQAHGENLELWWGNYLALAQDSAGVLQTAVEGATSYPELGLSAPLGEYRLVGRYDLVIMLPDGGARIVDWKTSRKRSQRETLATHMQTRVYPYLLARAGAALNAGKPIAPEAIEMVYWFAGFPEQPERFSYSTAAFEKDHADLEEMVDTIQRLAAGQFSMTPDEKRCLYCLYRSLCERGVLAGLFETEDFDEAETFFAGEDFEQILEIEF